MEAYDATDARRYLLRFGPGEELVEALVGWVSMRGGRATVRGTGAFASSVVADVEGEERKVAAAEAIAISGVVSDGAADLRVTLLRGMQPIGGRLVSAQAVGADLEVFVLDSDGSVEVSAPTTSTDGWGAAAAASAAAQEAAPSGATSWAEVAAASQAAATPARPTRKRKPKPVAPLFKPDPLPGGTSRKKDTAYLEEPQPEKGDFVLHKQFGKCRVERIGDDGQLLLKLPNGRRKGIKLTVLQVLEPHEDNQGRLVFPLQPRKKR